MNIRTRSLVAAAVLAISAVGSVAVAAERHPATVRGYVYDNRYNHGHYYPGAGTSFRALPPGAYGTRYRGSSWYFHGGAWYRPYGPRYIVAPPPIGIGISVLPPYYTTLWFGGVPYYYADDTYYLWNPDRQEYVVTEAPPDAAAPTTTAPASNPDLYAYPKQGQSESQQRTDRYECHEWATQQTGFDPTQPLGGVSAQDAATKRADYQRAERTCLEGRGYSVN
ncbi:MAG TPA: DUF6515 family protein [Steroidobacteraceae bacterium]|nr:DUF6515 family protein [Steroidobacteraceae bacterium]